MTKIRLIIANRFNLFERIVNMNNVFRYLEINYIRKTKTVHSFRLKRYRLVAPYTLAFLNKQLINDQPFAGTELELVVPPTPIDNNTWAAQRLGRKQPVIRTIDLMQHNDNF